MWERADLCSWKLEEHQLEVWELFEEWNARRRTTAYTDHVEAVGATMDDVWVEMLARRFGKTAKWIIGGTQICLRRPGAVGTYATALQKDIAEIIVPLANILLADGPDHLRPRYRGSQQGGHEGLYFPNGSIIRLVGIDQHPDALRGRFSDFFIISEAGFVGDLEETVRSVIIPQFQRRPWAFLALESSAPKSSTHDFIRKFVPDARLRGAYVARTIEDNVAIDPRDREKWIRQAGGRANTVCKREYFNLIERDEEKAVIPEFDPKRHVLSRETVGECRFAQAITGADPGSRDLFGLVWAYWDFLAARLVVQSSWAGRNPSTKRVAAICAATEYNLWGTLPPRKMGAIPLNGTQQRDGWFELLRGHELAHLGPILRELANREPDTWRLEGKWYAPPPPPTLSYWDGHFFRGNPVHRTTDVDVRLVQDLSIEYGLLFSPTAKDDAEAQRNALRNAHSDGKVVYLETAGPVIDHVKEAEWNEKRTDYERHPVFGHFDCLAALIYLWRNVSRGRNPYPPQYNPGRSSQTASYPWHTDVRQRSAEDVLQAHLAGRSWR